MDEIRRKLDRIDERLAGPGAVSRLIRTAPLLFPALGLMAGILLQNGLAPTRIGSNVWTILLGVVATATWGYFLHQRRNSRPGVLACGAALCFLCLGAIRLIAFALSLIHI